MLNYSIHTYQLYVSLSYDDYYDLYKKLLSMHASIEKQNSSDIVSYEKPLKVTKTHIYRKLKLPGISEIKLFRTVPQAPGSKEEGPLLKAGAYIRINPYNAIHGLHNSTHDIIDAYDIERAARMVSDMLLTLLGKELHKKLKLYRCDFCVNLPFDSPEKASLYIRLLQKCIPKPVLTEPTYNDPIAHHSVPKYPESLLLECGSYSFEVYSKQAQMQNKNIGDSECAAGLVRIELRAEKQKLITLFDNYESKQKDYVEFLSKASTICSQEIYELLAPMVGTGDFVSYSKLKKRISAKIKQETTQIEMLKYASLILKRKRCSSLLEENNITRSDWKQLLKKFDKIKCSPITIPARENIDFLPGISSWDEYFS